MKNKALEGGCFWGQSATRLAPLRRWLPIATARTVGAAVVAVLAGFPREGHTLLQGDPRHHEDQRGFCDDCGAPLYYQKQNFPENLYLHIGSFDKPDALPPDRHIWLSQRIPWHRIGDGLTRYDGLSNNTQLGNTPPYRDPQATPPGTRD